MTYTVIIGATIAEVTSGGETTGIIETIVQRAETWDVVDLMITAAAEAEELTGVKASVAVINEAEGNWVFTHGEHAKQLIQAYANMPHAELDELRPRTKPPRPEGATLH